MRDGRGPQHLLRHVFGRLTKPVLAKTVLAPVLTIRLFKRTIPIGEEKANFMNPTAARAIALDLCPDAVRWGEVRLGRGVPQQPALASGVHALDTLTGGFPRGAITEIAGPESSGRAVLANVLLASATGRGEICALVDTHGGFDAAAADAAGVRLPQLVWVRCGGDAAKAFRAADALLHAGGFGAVVLDLCRMTRREWERVPLSYWYRFRRAVEETPTVLAVLASARQGHACASLQLELRRAAAAWPGAPGFKLFRGIEIAVAPRKPVRNAEAKLSAGAVG